MRRLIRGNWLPVTERAKYSGPAVYAVRMLKRGRVVRIPRFLGIDPEGILTIGMTQSLEQRRRRFVAGYSRGHGHSAGNLLFPLLHGKLKSVAFELAFRPVNSAKIARESEAELTHQYWSRYGEAPPLTSAFAARYAHFRDG